ncbi:polysaccharide deacetylase family protein [Oscillochloris sp. ZM17-4]|uniref:polysaccharide deacetylase family protein n=1 Tax=Oscillochloris sp. ZM17-4 TaxID=2866714 RepID=UPI001C73C98C|nr:polysaccharide deacetylase family protein [Oscillochloris sp. ZM17-4]MBX0331187.1 polysaccharide deacetylase family protein [Oscillochloris sp. ZM17-4]
MRVTRLIIAALAFTAICAIFAYLPARDIFGRASAAQPDTYLPIITLPPQAATATPPATSPTPSSPATPVAGLYTYTFSIDRAAAPALSYNALSYIVHLGSASGASALVNGAPVASRYDPASGDLVFTTDQAGAVAVRFAAAAAPTVTIQKAALRDNKAWAWSHGMDDNVFLQAQVDLIAAKGWRASLMLIAKDIDDTRDEGWILDKPALRALRNSGWSLADHSWDHNCDSGASAGTLRQTIIDGYRKLVEIVSTSDDPSYQLITFAAPCFIGEYGPVFDDLLASGETTLRFNESQGNPLMNVDGVDYTSGDLTAAAMSAGMRQIGRDTNIEVDPAQDIATLDWMAANKAADRHFWFNTLSHGNQEGNLAQVLDHAYDAYGPGGSDELWMAPSDEIYSYLLIRDATVVTPGSLIAPAP